MNLTLRLIFAPLTVALLTTSLPLQVVRAEVDEMQEKTVAQATTSPARTATITVDGVIQLVNVEGGCYRLEANNGQSYELIGDFPKKDGLRVQVVGELLQDQSTICQVGKPFEVESVKVVQSDLPQRSLEINIFGIGPAVDAKAVSAIRSIIGKAIAKGVVDTYITYGYGIEGGSSSCIQLSRFQDPKQLQPLKNKFLKIKPNPKTTSYDVKAVATCAQRASSSVQVSEQLANTEWFLTELGGANVMSQPQNLTLRFDGPDRISGQGGCNLFSAKSQISGDQLTVGTLVSTRRACTNRAAQGQETSYFRALENAQRVSLEGSELLIYTQGLDKPLKFSRLTTGSQQMK